MSTIYAPADILWARVMKRIEVTSDGCWLWQGAVTSRGYGCIGAGRKGKNVTTHRLAVIARDGGIPDGLTVDHLCHNASKCEATTDCPHRRCVNPDHLDVCTIGLNAKRAKSRYLFCARGHWKRTRTDESAGTYTHYCECGDIETKPLPGWWFRELAEHLLSTG